MSIFSKPRYYFDYASAAPMTAPAVRAFRRASISYGNPGSPHEEGRKAKEILESARGTIARLSGVKSDGVIFTSGATESNALAIEGLIAGLEAKGAKRSAMHVLYLPTSHASLVETVRALEATGVAVEVLRIIDGQVSLSDLQKQLRPETVLVAMDTVCGETGTRYDTREVRTTLKEAAKGTGRHIYLHVDATQMPYSESIQLDRVGADTLTLDAQKIGGVRGIGALICARNVPLTGIVHGGGQEGGLRSGTPAHALASAFATVLVECDRSREDFVVRALRARTYLTEILTRSISNVAVNEGKDNTPHILNFSIVGRDTDYLQALLDTDGFAVSTRSACETDSTGSRVVLSLTGDAERASSTLRISWGRETRSGDFKKLADAIIKDVGFLDSTTAGRNI